MGELGQVIPFRKPRGDLERYKEALTDLLVELGETRRQIMGRTIELAMAKAWREWDKEQAIGAQISIDLEMLLEASDPNVRRAANALAAIESVYYELGGPSLD